ncbi:hypothetical protein [Pseudomonas vanderleydeniana]|uniref:Secreted protein n=1 Tax=Pseudomonas vanderleydeniana TaxID=2745495 RepID=A0A9E6PN19_9PSED|nr:hypothetical protein [Pseudomonas vanderleydeniana]QXI29493.1 hypothetical protein HU752_005930 [Pseudomonas vanderleydeniana]
MSSSMGVASLFVLSAVMLSPLAHAEESQSFVAQNAARAAARQDRAEMTAKAKSRMPEQHSSVSAGQPDSAKDS